MCNSFISTFVIVFTGSITVITLSKVMYHNQYRFMMSIWTKYNENSMSYENVF